jgi:hypothetical protein
VSRLLYESENERIAVKKIGGGFPDGEVTEDIASSLNS